jgi:hypothetical protein
MGVVSCSGWCASGVADKVGVPCRVQEWSSKQWISSLPAKGDNPPLLISFMAMLAITCEQICRIYVQQ